MSPPLAADSSVGPLKVFGLRLTSKLQKQLFGKILTQDTDFFDSASASRLPTHLHFFPGNKA